MHYYIIGTGIYLLCDTQDVYDLDSSHFRTYLPPLLLWPSSCNVNLKESFILSVPNASAPPGILPECFCHRRNVLILARRAQRPG